MPTEVLAVGVGPGSPLSSVKALSLLSSLFSSPPPNHTQTDYSSGRKVQRGRKKPSNFRVCPCSFFPERKRIQEHKDYVSTPIYTVPFRSFCE